MKRDRLKSTRLLTFQNVVILIMCCHQKACMCAQNMSSDVSSNDLFNRNKRQNNLTIDTTPTSLQESHTPAGFANLSYKNFSFDPEATSFLRTHFKDGRPIRMGHFQNSNQEENMRCYRPTTCEPLKSSACLGATLSYKSTSYLLVNASSSLEIQEQLDRWRSLQRIPRCWAVVQAFLCAVYMPKCENGWLTMPTQELCRVTRGPCRILETWPHFLQCDEDRFPSGCKSPVLDMKINTSAHCQAPLIENEKPSTWYSGMEGCSLQCQNPLVTTDSTKRIHLFVMVFGSLCLTCNIFTVLTFLVDWRYANRYPAVIILYINGCYMFACIGWMAQFTTGARDDIVCSHDGTLRKGEPSANENLSCVTVFILIYYFVMAAAVWFVILTYSWYKSFHVIGIPRETIRSKSAYFHLVAWSAPLVLTITVMALCEIDGDYISGICFVGYTNITKRILFLLIPIIISVVCGGFFLARGLMVLIKAKIGSEEVISAQINTKIKNMIARIALFSFCICICVLGTITCHIHDYMHKAELEKSLHHYIVCLALHSTDASHAPCQLESRPNLMMIYLHQLCMFVSGIVMSSWVWTPATIDSWQRFFQRVCNKPTNEPTKMKRHKLIAQAFAHRKELGRGPIAINYESTHGDPVGMNLDINSVASHEPTSTWASAFPTFITRRGAILGGRPFAMRQYSSTSDLSQCPIPLNLRRHSLDSQVSAQLSEKDWIAAAQAHARALARNRKRKTRKERERFVGVNSRISPLLFMGRRGSESSQQSTIGIVPIGGKVTKATSTGDLGQVNIFPSSQPTYMMPVVRPLVQRQPIVIPPFTHGMADISHMPQIQQQTAAIQPRPAPRPMRMMPFDAARTNFSSFAAPGFMAPGMGFVRPSPMPYVPYGQMPYGYPFYGMAAAYMPEHEPIIPLHPMPDSASEGEFFPIVMSDSEYTDTGFRSYEEHILSAQRFVQDHINAVVSMHTPKPPQSGPFSITARKSGRQSKASSTGHVSDFNVNGSNRGSTANLPFVNKPRSRAPSADEQMQCLLSESRDKEIEMTTYSNTGGKSNGQYTGLVKQNSRANIRESISENAER